MRHLGSWSPDKLWGPTHEINSMLLIVLKGVKVRAVQHSFSYLGSFLRAGLSCLNESLQRSA